MDSIVFSAIIMRFIKEEITVSVSIKEEINGVLAPVRSYEVLQIDGASNGYLLVLRNFGAVSVSLDTPFTISNKRAVAFLA